MTKVLSPQSIKENTDLSWLWFLTLALPLFFFFWLDQVPALDPILVAPYQHFIMVSLTAYVAFVISVFTAVILGGQRNRRATWMAMGLASLSGIFAVHGLATPGFLMGSNVMVGAAAPQSLLAGGICFACAVYETDGQQTFGRIQHRWLWGGWSLAMMLYWSMAFLWNAPFTWLQVWAPYLQYVVAFATVGLYTFAALGAAELRRRKQWTVAPFFMAASILLAISVVGQTWGEIWRLSWWTYHVDMLVAFLLVLVGTIRTYEQFRTFHLTPYFTLVAAIFLGIAFFAAHAASNTILAAELADPARARVELVLLVAVAGLLLLLFAALLAIVQRGDRLLRERQQSLVQARQRLETILDAQPDGVVVLTGQHEIERANPVVQHWLAGDHPAVPPSQLQSFLASVCADPSTEHEVEFGPITLRARAARFEDEGVVVLLHDISRLKELDRMKTEFVSTVSHELRTPLTNLKLYLSLLRNGKPENQQRYLDTLEQESARLNMLVDKVLDISRLDTRKGSPLLAEPVDLNRLVEQVVDRYAALIDSRQMQVVLDLDADLPAIPGDVAMLTQMLVNLLGNALNYTQQAGTVRLATLGTGPEQVLFTITDNGPGIPPEDIDNIFKRFYRGDTGHASGAPGSGLGLAIVKEIVEQHNGQISVSSRVGNGTTFRVVLPIACPSPAAVPAPSLDTTP